MDWKKIEDIIDIAVRLFSVIGIAIIDTAAGMWIGTQLLPFNKILAKFLFFISGFCPIYLLLSYISDFISDVLKQKGGQNGNNNVGKS